MQPESIFCIKPNMFPVTADKHWLNLNVLFNENSSHCISLHCTVCLFIWSNTLYFIATFLLCKLLVIYFPLINQMHNYIDLKTKQQKKKQRASLTRIQTLRQDSWGFCCLQEFIFMIGLIMLVWISLSCHQLLTVFVSYRAPVHTTVWPEVELWAAPPKL